MGGGGGATFENYISTNILLPPPSEEAASGGAAYGRVEAAPRDAGSAPSAGAVRLTPRSRQSVLFEQAPVFEQAPRRRAPRASRMLTADETAALAGSAVAAPTSNNSSSSLRGVGGETRLRKVSFDGNAAEAPSRAPRRRGDDTGKGGKTKKKKLANGKELL